MRRNAGELHTDGTDKHLAWRSNTGVGSVSRPTAAMKYGAGNENSIYKIWITSPSREEVGVGNQYYFNPSPGRGANWKEIHRFGIQITLRRNSICSFSQLDKC